jgi:histidinol-phosphate aminotransferase
VPAKNPKLRSTRREFGKSVGALLAAACISPKIMAQPAAEQAKAAERDEVIRIDFNENPYGPCPRAISAIASSEAIACRYPDALRVRAVHSIAALNHVAPENVVLGCGSTEILRACDAAFVGAQKQLVIAEPTFEAVTYYANVCRARAAKVPLTSDFRHDLPAMARACANGAGLVYVCNPNNPTATINTRAEFEDFISKVPASTSVLVDEAYFHFVEDPRYTSVIDMISQHRNLIVARTFSKVYGMAGLRLGYAVGQRDTIQSISQQLTFDNGNAAVLLAAIASLNDPEIVPLNKKRLNNSRKWVMDQLVKTGYRVIPSQANFFMVDTGAEVTPVIHAFYERKILVGRKFPSMPNWLRVTVGKPEEMQKFLSVFREIVAVRKSAVAVS